VSLCSVVVSTASPCGVPPPPFSPAESRGGAWRCGHHKEETAEEDSATVPPSFRWAELRRDQATVACSD
jgi:hypothetical protein